MGKTSELIVEKVIDGTTCALCDEWHPELAPLAYQGDVYYMCRECFHTASLLVNALQEVN